MTKEGRLVEMTKEGRLVDMTRGGREKPIIINSGYRSPQLNKKIGGGAY